MDNSEDLFYSSMNNGISTQPQLTSSPMSSSPMSSSRMTSTHTPALSIGADVVGGPLDPFNEYNMPAVLKYEGDTGDSPSDSSSVCSDSSDEFLGTGAPLGMPTSTAATIGSINPALSGSNINLHPRGNLHLGARPIGIAGVTKGVPPPPAAPTKSVGMMNGMRRRVPIPKPDVDMMEYGGNEISETVRRRRLARKAELARQSRKRKKERLAELEVENVNIRQELERVRKQRKLDLQTIEQLRSGKAAQNVVTVVEPATGDSKPAPDELKTALQLIINAMGNDKGAACTQFRLTKLLDGFTANLSKLDKVATVHLTKLVQSSDVPLPIRFLEWAMSQENSFFTEDEGLWSGLFDKIGFSSQQMQQLMALQDKMVLQKQYHEQALEQGRAFGESLKKLHNAASANFADIRSVFTERQLAQYFVWCEENKLCIRTMTARK